MSLPLWERGLKCSEYGRNCPRRQVAPLVGAWIEIDEVSKLRDVLQVAPLVGAWIEIVLPLVLPLVLPSLPLWERGLKSGS